MRSTPHFASHFTTTTLQDLMVTTPCMLIFKWKLHCQSNLPSLLGGFFITGFNAQKTTPLSPPNRGSSWFTSLDPLDNPISGTEFWLYEVTTFANTRPFIYNVRPRPANAPDVGDVDGMTHFVTPHFMLGGYPSGGFTLTQRRGPNDVVAHRVPAKQYLVLNPAHHSLPITLGQPTIIHDPHNHTVPILTITFLMGGLYGRLPPLSIPLAVRNSAHANAFHCNYLPFISIFGSTSSMVDSIIHLNIRGHDLYAPGNRMSHIKLHVE